MPRRLYRSRSDRMLFGVAGGMADYLDLDPSLVRIVWALLVLAGGAGILLYLIAAIVVPEAPEGYVSPPPPPGAPGSGTPASGTPGAAGAAGFTSQATPGTGGRGAASRPGGNNGAIVLGGILVLVGGVLLLQRFLPQIDGDILWPVLLLVIGGALVVGAMRR